jgi:hypothetical protein
MTSGALGIAAAAGKLEAEAYGKGRAKQVAVAAKKAATAGLS